MKKLLSILLICFILLSSLLVFASCGDEEPTPEVTPDDPEPTPVETTQLQTPKVKINEEGIATWKAISGATGYIVLWNDFEQEVQTELSFELLDGDTIQVKAVSTSESKTDSEYSSILTYIEEDVISDYY